MGLWSTIFGSTSVIEKGTDALISAGDKLVYTDEEKADMKKQMIPLHIELMKASHPFKITQRLLAVWFSFLFGLSFIIGLIMEIINIIIKFRFIPTEIMTEPRLLDTASLFKLVEVFGLVIIVGIIIGFYFSGGTLESLKRTFIKK